jgi:cobyrinic acid a,c-diamide synthase
MGLFDGTPSAADIAERFGIPVLALIDAGSMAQTFGAVAHGLATYRPGLPFAGVLANRVASPRHAEMLKESLSPGMGWFGALPKSSDSLPERHLGLLQAAEIDDLEARLDKLADALQASATVDLPMPVTFAAVAPPELPPLLAGRRIAIARDAAYGFIYPANLETLQTLGAELCFFSPVAGDALPDCDAVWLPGGYPELHAATLGANHTLRDALRAHAAAGKPVWAECGGMMLLFDTLVDKAGTAHAMWGLLPGTVRMQARLAALGPQQLDWPGQGDVHPPALRGHTFHWSVADTPLTPVARTRRPGTAAQPVASGADGEALYQLGPVRASYFHAWFASSPATVAHLFRALPGKPTA